MKKPMFAMSIVRTGLREKIEKGICAEPGCGVFLTKTEKEECNGYCRTCHSDNQNARYPAHPDNRRA